MSRNIDRDKLIRFIRGEAHDRMYGTSEFCRGAYSPSKVDKEWIAAYEYLLREINSGRLNADD